MEGNLFTSSPGREEPLLHCPHCGLEHILSFLPVSAPLQPPDDPPARRPVDKLKLATYYYELHGSRVLNFNRVDQGGSDDYDVTNWPFDLDIILAQALSASKTILIRDYKLRFRDVTADDAFADVGAATAISYDASTVLVNDTDHTEEAYRRCTPPDGFGYHGVAESEGDNIHSEVIWDEDYVEIQWALSPLLGTLGHQYEFQIFDITEDAIVGTSGATLRLAYPILLGATRFADASQADESGADDADVTNWEQANHFILAVRLYQEGTPGTIRNISLQWRNVTDSGSFAAVSTTGEIRYSSDTSLVNDAFLLSGEAICDGEGGYLWQNGKECEGDNNITRTYSAGYYTECQFALECTTAPDLKEYEFRIIDETIGPMTLATCLATISTAGDSTQAPRSMHQFALRRS